MELTNESKTLFIPLLGKAMMSKANLFLHDSKAEEIISSIDYDFKALKQSKWLSMYMSARAMIFDEICNEYIKSHNNATIIHLGCGLDSRCLRVSQDFLCWYDIDYENVMDIRRKFYAQDEKHKMIGSSVLDYHWLDQIKHLDNIIIIAEGLTMYLSEEEIKTLIAKINEKIGSVHLLFDAYTKKGVKGSKIKNPINQMNAEIKYGLDTPDDFLALNNNLEYVATHFIKKDDNNLRGLTKFIFNKIYCGKLSQSFYKIYEFELKEEDNKKKY